jgi:transposase
MIAHGTTCRSGILITVSTIARAYVFRAKRADRIKLIFWDGTGLCLFAKRLEDGIFRWPKIEDGMMRLRHNYRPCWQGWTGGAFMRRARRRRLRSRVDDLSCGEVNQEPAGRRKVRPNMI